MDAWSWKEPWTVYSAMSRISVLFHLLTQISTNGFLAGSVGTNSEQQESVLASIRHAFHGHRNADEQLTGPYLPSLI